MDLRNRILIPDQGPFNRGLAFEDGCLSYLAGDPLLAIVNWSNNSNAFEELSKISAFSDITNVKDEVTTSLWFSEVDSEIIKNVHLYYINYEKRRINMDYLYDENHDFDLVELILFEALPQSEYPWLNLKGTKDLDSNIFYVEQNQVEQIGDTLCFKLFKNSNPRIDRLSLELIA